VENVRHCCGGGTEGQETELAGLRFRPPHGRRHQLTYGSVYGKVPKELITAR
jgi:hypothetical protein